MSRLLKRHYVPYEPRQKRQLSLCALHPRCIQQGKHPLNYCPAIIIEKKRPFTQSAPAYFLRVTVSTFFNQLQNKLFLTRPFSYKRVHVPIILLADKNMYAKYISQFQKARTFLSYRVFTLFTKNNIFHPRQ